MVTFIYPSQRKALRHEKEKELDQDGRTGERWSWGWSPGRSGFRSCAISPNTTQNQTAVVLALMGLTVYGEMGRKHTERNIQAQRVGRSVKKVGAMFIPREALSGALRMEGGRLCKKCMFLGHMDQLGA